MWVLTGLDSFPLLFVSQNRALRRIFRCKREGVAGGWRRLHNEELRNLYNSSDITGFMKSENLKGKDYSEDLGVNGKRIL
jgi:hypothetical protein